MLSYPTSTGRQAHRTASPVSSGSAAAGGCWESPGPSASAALLQGCMHAQGFKAASRGWAQQVCFHSECTGGCLLSGGAATRKRERPHCQAMPQLGHVLLCSTQCVPQLETTVSKPAAAQGERQFHLQKRAWRLCPQPEPCVQTLGTMTAAASARSATCGPAARCSQAHY